MKHPESFAANERLARVLPGGNTRSATYYAPFPIVLDKGAGCRVWDVDGQVYLDFLNNFTATIHGHGHPRICEQLARAVWEGTVFPAPQLAQAELAERITARFASIDSVRFCNSGSEAVMMAVRAARAFTGREQIVKLRGGYHGTWDQVAVGAHEAENEASASDYDRGIPACVRGLVHQVQVDDLAALTNVMDAHGPQVAAILLEPILGHVIQKVSLEFLQTARALAIRYGALLIFDEVVTARLHEGGFQGLSGIHADLTTLGKIIGGGLPIGAFGGRRDVMAQFDPRQSDALSHHGTYNGGTLAMVAGVVSLDLLDPVEIDRINALGLRLWNGVEHALRARKLGFASEAGSLVHVHSPHMRAIHLACLDQGLYLAARGQMSISTPMDETVVDDAIARFGAALDGVTNTLSVAP